MPRRPTDTQETARAGRAKVLSALKRLGMVGREQRDGQINYVYVRREGSPGEVRLWVKSKRRGDWQTSIRYGNTNAVKESPTTFWAFVDLVDCN